MYTPNIVMTTVKTKFDLLVSYFTLIFCPKVIDSIFNRNTRNLCKDIPSTFVVWKSSSLVSKLNTLFVRR